MTVQPIHVNDTIAGDDRWSAMGARTAILAIMAVVLDGFDIQLIGLAIPSLMREWGLDRAAFVPVIAFGLIAMSVGTALVGMLGDRIGRRWSLIGSMMLFGTATFATAFVADFRIFLLLRLVASLGLGGAMPSAVAILAEFAPARRRGFAVTCGMVCTPLGGLLAGLVSAMTLADHGWQVLFLIGGVLPLALAAILIFALPESPAFLAKKMQRRDGSGAGYAALFAGGMARDTLYLWLAFLAVLTACYCVFNWLPTLLGQSGFTIAAAGTGLAAFNGGGIAGALAGAVMIDRQGSRRLTSVFGLAGLIFALLTGVLLQAGMIPATLAALCVTGFFVAGLQPMLFAVAAHLYPEEIRGTGVGSALAIGRIGAVASAAIGAFVVGLGIMPYFVSISVFALIAVIALLGLRRHVPARVPPKGQPA